LWKMWTGSQHNFGLFQMCNIKITEIQDFTRRKRKHHVIHYVNQKNKGYVENLSTIALWIMWITIFLLVHFR
jgi:hypothetical protein